MAALRLKRLGLNMTEIEWGDGVVLFSYDTPVAAWYEHLGYVKTEQYWSRTTTKHINKWKEREEHYVDAVAYNTKPQAWFDDLIVV